MVPQSFKVLRFDCVPITTALRLAPGIFAVKGVAHSATPFSAAKVYHGRTGLSRNWTYKIRFLETTSKAVLQRLIALEREQSKQESNVDAAKGDQSHHGHDTTGNDRDPE